MTCSNCSEDREKQYERLFSSSNLTGSTLNSLNGHGVGVAVRKATAGEAWVDDLVNVLKGMMDPAAANDMESADMKVDRVAQKEKAAKLAQKLTNLQHMEDPNFEERIPELDESNQGLMVLRLDRFNLAAAEDALCPNTENDMQSIATTNNTAVPGDHAQERMLERNISIPEIKEAKKRGFVSLSIILNGNDDMDQVKSSICSWAHELTNASIFVGLAAGERLAAGEPQVRGNKSDRRLEITLLGSEKRGPHIKKWLTAQKYFEVWNRRITFRMVQEQSKWLVVVEGRIAPNVVGMVTVLRRDGNARICEFRHVKWLGKQLLDLIINEGDGADEVNEFKEILSKHARFIGGRSTWVIGEFPGQNLSEWHISENRERPITLLMWAAKSGSLRIVESLVNDYNCNVTVAQKIVTEDTGVTALHVAAYCGHAAVVDFLLQSGADKNQVNTLYKDITPLDSAKRGLVLHPEMSEQFNVIIDKLESWE